MHNNNETIANLQGSGTVGLGSGTLTVGQGSFSGVIQDSNFGAGGNLTKTGTDTLTLTGANTFTGTTTIAGGSLVLSGSGSLSGSSPVNITSATGIFDLSAISASSQTIGSLSGVVGSSVVLGGTNLVIGGANSNTTFAGVISGTDGSLTKVGTGTTTLTGVNSYTGATTVNGGTLVADVSGNPSALSSSSALVLGTGGAFELSNTSATSRTQVMDGLTVNAGNNSIVINNPERRHDDVGFARGPERDGRDYPQSRGIGGFPLDAGRQFRNDGDRPHRAEE